MVDIETLGTKSYATILSLGAIFFDIKTGELGEAFHKSVKISSCLNVGLEVNPKTALWWIGQEEALEQWAKSEKFDLTQVLDEFSEFCKSNIPNILEPEPFYIWGNSNRFDMGLIENAYTKIGKEIPWRFRDERDVRTLSHYGPDIRERVIKEAKESGAVVHDALEDCKIQIKYCTEINNKIEDAIRNQSFLTTVAETSKYYGADIIEEKK